MVRSDVAGSDSRVKSNIVDGAFVDPVPAFGSLTASREPETVRRIIASNYDFTPSLQYCVDLIAFVEALTDGQR